MYSVYWHAHYQDFTDIDAAIEFAKNKVRQCKYFGDAVTILDMHGNGGIIGVVTDDYNGLVLHKLSTWPTNLALLEETVNV